MTDDQRQAAIALLTERGIDEPGVFADGMEYEALIATVAYFDDKPGEKGAGLLVHMLRSGKHGGYRRPGERTAAPAREITPRLEQAVRGNCESPNGCTRGEARDVFRLKAEKGLGIPVDELLDRVMGADWHFTPPHPMYDMDLPPEERAAAMDRFEREKREREGVAA